MIREGVIMNPVEQLYDSDPQREWAREARRRPQPEAQSPLKSRIQAEGKCCFTAWMSRSAL